MNYQCKELVVVMFMRVNYNFVCPYKSTASHPKQL